MIITVARKPPENTLSANVAKHGTGLLNVENSRIGETKEVPRGFSRTSGTSYTGSVDGSLRRCTGRESGYDPNVGRWPANLIFVRLNTNHPLIRYFKVFDD